MPSRIDHLDSWLIPVWMMARTAPARPHAHAGNPDIPSGCRTRLSHPFIASEGPPGTKIIGPNEKTPGSELAWWLLAGNE